MADANIVLQNLRAGVAAHKSGNRTTAWLKMQAALRDDPDNVSALLWLAFLSETFEKRVFFFNRVLEIDPENARVLRGLEWAKHQRDNTAHTATEPEATPVEPSSPMHVMPARSSSSVPRAVDASQTVDELKESIEPDELQKNAKKGIIAQRARRRFRPLIAVLIFGFAVISMVTAAWLILGNRVLLADLRPTATVMPAPATATDTATPLPPTETPPPSPTPDVSTSTVPPPTATAIAVVLPTSTSPPLPPPPTATPLPPETPAAVPEPGLIHQPNSPGERWIEVDLSEQSLTAWEGLEPVMHFSVSAGLPGTPTVEGEFHIYVKLVSTRMSGQGYDLPGVPHTMYFYEGYALHGAYWHNNFGEPMSRGCVNLALPDAEKLFYWAGPVLPDGNWVVRATEDNPGSLVIVHN